MTLKQPVFLFVCVLFIHHAKAEGNETTLSPKSTETPTTLAPTTTTLHPKVACENASASCEACVKITQCFYCTTTKKCAYYPYNHVFPRSSECDLGDVRWGVCWFNFKALIITISVLGGVLIISCIICICCCCRRKKKNSRLIQENAKREREREERRIRNQEKQKERESKYNEIRRKYGLMKDDSQPYQRFEA